MTNAIPVEPKPTTAEPTIVSTAVNYTVPTSANYLVLISATAANVVVTVPSTRSHKIINTGANAVVVDSTTADNVTVTTGQAVEVIWSSANSRHYTHLSNSSTALTPVGSVYATLSNSLSAADIGKPLCRNSVLSDTSNTQYFSHVLLSVVSASVLHVAGSGCVVSIDNALLDGGAAYNIATSGAFLYWDSSAAKYKADKQADADAQSDAVLELLTVGATTFDARVL